MTENSETDNRREHTKSAAEWALRRLAANLIRIIRGAGEPWRIVHDAATFLQAWDTALNAGVPPEELAYLSSALVFDGETKQASQLPGDALTRKLAENTIIRGALQFTASQLLKQRTQEARGEHEMLEGIRELDDIREANRRAGFRR